MNFSPIPSSRLPRVVPFFYFYTFFFLKNEKRETRTSLVLFFLAIWHPIKTTYRYFTYPNDDGKTRMTLGSFQLLYYGKKGGNVGAYFLPHLSYRIVYLILRSLQLLINGTGIDDDGTRNGG